MRALLLPVATVLALAGALLLGTSENDAYAKGTAIGFTPDAGPAHEEVMVSGGSWPENTEVRLFAAFSPLTVGGYPRAEEFVGPFEIVRSDTEGRWDALFVPDTIVGLSLPREPGYLIVRAESDDLPLYLEAANSNHFVLTVDGQRPPGSGAIDVAFTMAEGGSADLAVWGYRSVGRTDFTSSYGLVPISFEPTIPSVGDGEYEIVIVTNGGHEPIGPNTVDVTGARLCLNPSCHPSAPIIEVHSAYRVTVQNAEVVEANIVLGSLPDPLVPPQDPEIKPLLVSAPEDDGRAGLIAGASVLLAVLLAGAATLGYRRVTR